MSTIKSHIAQAIKIFGIMAIVAAFAAAAFPTRSFAASNVGKLTVKVYQISTSPTSPTVLEPLAGANIEVFDVNGHSIATVNADNNGSITLELPKGLYKVHVSAPGFKSVSGSAAVDAGATTSIKLKLASTSRNTIGLIGR